MLRPTQEDTRDSAQESLTRLLRYRDTEPASAWRPLLYRIARNLLNEQWRRARSHREQYNVPVDSVELPDPAPPPDLAIQQAQQQRSEEHTSELQSLMRISYAVFCLKQTQKL